MKIDGNNDPAINKGTSATQMINNMSTAVNRKKKALLKSKGLTNEQKKAIKSGKTIDTSTNSIDRGMPVEEIKEILGHVKLDTTLIYAKVSKENIKHDHRKYII